MNEQQLIAGPGTPADAGAQVSVVGGGLAGLVAAIRAAELGVPVVVHEAHGQLGGRARSTAPPYVANLGPHAMYADGAFWRFLTDRGITVPTATPPVTGLRFRCNGTIRRTPPAAMLRAFLGRRRQAPAGSDFRSWAASQWGEKDAEVLCGAAGVFAFCHDPGALSAAFVAERFSRVYALPSPARYVQGGWSTLVAALERRARALGVRIHAQSRIDQLPQAPVIVATSMPAAARLLGDRGLHWTGTTCVVLDVAVSSRDGDPWIVCDVDEGGWVERFSRTDPGLAPAGHELLQAQIGVRPDEAPAAALERLQAVLDAGFPHWRRRLVWSRKARLEAMTGAVDYPGASWRDRPRIDRSGGVYVATDMSAAPGLLSEVCVTAALQAAELAAAACRPGSSPRSPEASARQGAGL